MQDQGDGSGQDSVEYRLLLQNITKRFGKFVAVDNVGPKVKYKPFQKRNIGVAFENYASFPHMTVFNHIAFPMLKARKLLPTAKRIDC